MNLVATWIIDIFIWNRAIFTKKHLPFEGFGDSRRYGRAPLPLWYQVWVPKGLVQEGLIFGLCFVLYFLSVSGFCSRLGSGNSISPPVLLSDAFQQKVLALQLRAIFSQAWYVWLKFSGGGVIPPRPPPTSNFSLLILRWLWKDSLTLFYIRGWWPPKCFWPLRSNTWRRKLKVCDF